MGSEIILEEFPGGPVVGIQCFNCCDLSSNPGWWGVKERREGRRRRREAGREEGRNNTGLSWPQFLSQCSPDSLCDIRQVTNSLSISFPIYEVQGLGCIIIKVPLRMTFLTINRTHSFYNSKNISMRLQIHLTSVKSCEIFYTQINSFHLEALLLILRSHQN